MVVAQTSSSVLGIPVPRSLLSKQCIEIFHSLWRLHLCCLRFSPTRGSWYRLVSRLIGPKASSTSFHKFSFPVFSHLFTSFPPMFSSTSFHRFSFPSYFQNKALFSWRRPIYMFLLHQIYNSLQLLEFKTTTQQQRVMLEVDISFLVVMIKFLFAIISFFCYYQFSFCYE